MSIEFPTTLKILLSWESGFTRPHPYYIGG
jgi:hypothetical protein